MRRKLSLVVLLLTAVAVSACSDVTAPSQIDDCGPVGGSHTCQQ